MLEDTSSLALVKVTAVMEQLSALSYTLSGLLLSFTRMLILPSWPPVAMLSP